MPDSEPQTRSQRYRDVLDYKIGARVIVEFTMSGREVIDYAVVLTVDEDGEGGNSARVRWRARRQRHAPP